METFTLEKEKKEGYGLSKFFYLRWRERAKELELSLCAFNYEHLCGVQPPGTRGEASTSAPAATLGQLNINLNILKPTGRKVAAWGLMQALHV